MPYDVLDSTVVGFCSQIKQALTRVSSANVPERMFQKVGALEWVLGPFNQPEESVSNLVSERDNTITTTEIIYRQRGTVDDIEIDRANWDCDYAERDLKSCTFEIEDWRGTKGRSVSAQRFKQLCAGGSPMDSFIMQDIFADLNALRVSVNTALLTHLSATCVGVNINYLVSDVPSASAKAVDILDADGNPIPFGISQIIQDMDLNQLQGPFGLIGGGNLQLMGLQNKWGCCNDGGLNLESVNNWLMNNMVMYVDHAANTVLGDNNFLVVAPTVAQMPMYLENAGAYTVEYNQNYAHLTFPDPLIPRLMYDLDIKYDSCNKKWNYSVGLHFDFWCWCSDVFAATDDLSGVTGVFLYNANQTA